MKKEFYKKKYADSFYSVSDILKVESDSKTEIDALLVVISIAKSISFIKMFKPKQNLILSSAEITDWMLHQGTKVSRVGATTVKLWLENNMSSNFLIINLDL